VDQLYLVFLVPVDAETYVGFKIHISARGKLVARDRSVLDSANSTTVVNNLDHSLFCQYSIKLHGIPVSSSKDLFIYKS